MTPADANPTLGFRHRPLWLLAVAAVVAGQAGFALKLFDADRSWAAAFDDRPVLDGRHPLHLYHGSLGAGTFRERMATTCYDPCFQAGYPKTPVFDGGSRPAELMLALVGRGECDAAAYKLGLFLLCLLAPLALVAAARGFGASAAGSCWAAVGGCFVWWSPPVRAVLDAGRADALLAGLAVLVFLGGMAKYAREPGVTGWLMLAAASVVGWFAHPVAWCGLLPVVAGWYLVNAPRHGPAWHLGAVGVPVAGVVPNVWWLGDWCRFWWVRHGTMEEGTPLPTLAEFLGTPGDYLSLLPPTAFGWALALLGAAGLLTLVRRGRRCEAGVLFIATLVAVAVTRLGRSWTPAADVGADHAAALVPAVAAVLAGYALGEVLKSMKLGVPLTAGAAALVGLCGWFDGPVSAVIPDALPQVPVMHVGLSSGQEQLVEALKALTTRDARTLVEEADPTRPGWNWTALLPPLTDRLYIGGLDPHAGVEHSYCGMADGNLAGKPFAEWQADDRRDFCRKYNVGWVLARTPEAERWWLTEPGSKVLGRYDDRGERATLIALNRPRSFVLSGSATVERMDRGRIILTDLKPDAEGWVSLSLHYQRELRAAPIAQAFPARDPSDPIPLTKLYVGGPVSRVTLTWEHP